MVLSKLEISKNSISLQPKQPYIMSQKILLTSKEVNIILHRLACQLIERHLDFSETIGIKSKLFNDSPIKSFKDSLESEGLNIYEYLEKLQSLRQKDESLAFSNES